jgi:hydrogenase maturation protease
MTAERVAVLGLGNPVVSDDRAGLAVAAALRRRLDEAPLAGVTVLEGTRGGFEIIDLLTGFDRAIVVDSLRSPHPSPGRVRKLTLADAAGSVRLINAHELSIAEAFALAGRLGIPMPRDVEILGIEGGDLSTLSEAMTPPVAAAAERLAGEIYARLAETGRRPR